MVSLDVSEIEVRKRHEPAPVIELAQADWLVRQSSREVELSSSWHVEDAP